MARKNHMIPQVSETCDHCNKRVLVLWRDKEHWLLCPSCWPSYHLPTEATQRAIIDYQHKPEYYKSGPNDAYWNVHCSCGWSSAPSFRIKKREATAAFDGHKLQVSK